MQTILRRIMILMVGFSVATASGFAPRHALASLAKPQQHQIQILPQHDHAAAAHAHKPVSAMAHHHATDCDETGKTRHEPAAADHNCCVTSCPAIVSISALNDFHHDLPKSRFELPLMFGLALSALASIEPPPR